MLISEKLVGLELGLTLKGGVLVGVAGHPELEESAARLDDSPTVLFGYSSVKRLRCILSLPHPTV